MRSQRLNRRIAYALSRPTAYLIVGLVFLAVVVAVIGRWPSWVIGASIAVGLVLFGLLILDALFDPNTEREAALSDVDPGRVRDPALREKLRKALEYVRAAQQLVKQDKSGLLDTADEELPELERAARSIYQMSLRLQEFRADRLLQRDLADLRKLSKQEGPLNPDREAQLKTLRRLDDLVSKAEQAIDSALADLGRSYAEMQAIKVTPGLCGRATDSLEQLQSSTRRLSDLAQGYDEAYGGRTVPGNS
ncbi:MAG: hypothetical protein EPO21_17055 [Chloroflexota bacterium]|nr:MAG: hypothetical protein EPO21_17055 [Chloroflexota bacterium]